jgi:beta-lactamase class A
MHPTTNEQSTASINANANKHTGKFCERFDGNLFIIVLFLVIGILVGFLLQTLTNKNNSAKETSTLYEKRLYGDYKYINPLLECVSDLGAYQPINKLKDKVNTYINSQKSSNKTTEVAVYYRDLNNGPWFGIDESSLFSPASLVKVPLMIAYLELSEHTPGLLEKKIVNTLENTDELYSGIGYIVEDRIKVGSEYTVEELIVRMVSNSDNVAYSLLFDYIANTDLQKVYSDFGVDVSKSYNNPDGDTMTLKAGW